MDFNTMIGLIVEHGFVIVFLGLCVMFMIGFGKRVFALMDIWINKQRKKTPQQIDALNEEDNKVDKEINNILFSILANFNPDKVMILQYHNGSYYNSGQHMKFVSCTHEQPNIGVAPSAMEFQRIPSAIFQPVNSPLMNGKNVIQIPKVNEEHENDDMRTKLLREVYTNLNFKSYYAFALRTHQGQLIGKVTLVGMGKEIEYTEDQIKGIQAETGKIESLLNVNLLK